MLLTPGYFQSTFFPKSYWVTDYWPEYNNFTSTWPSSILSVSISQDTLKARIGQDILTVDISQDKLTISIGD